MRAFVVAVAFVLLLSASGLSAPPVEARNPFTVLEQRMLARTGGDLAVVGEHVVGHGDGAWSERITAADFLAHARDFLARTGYGADGISAPDVSSGFGIASKQLAKAVGWPYCDYASIFVAWEGAAGTPSAIVEADTSPVDVPGEAVCDDFYGPTHTYVSTAIDARESGEIVLVSCHAAEFPSALTRHAPPPLGGLGYTCGANDASLHGNVVMVSESFCFFGTCIGFDALLGGTAVLVVGDVGAV